MLLGYNHTTAKGLGVYSDGNGHYYDDAGNPLTAVPDDTPTIATATTTELMCDPNAAYPVGSVCWGIQQGIDAKALAASLVPKAAAPCMGTPVVKGVSNCLLAAGAAAVALFLFAQNR